MRDYGPVDRHAIAGLQRDVRLVFVALSLMWAVGTVGRAQPASETTAPLTDAAASASQSPILPIPLTMALDPARVALGERLFHDVRLSGDNTMACATCHQLAQGGDDGKPQARTANGRRGPRNAPTIFNVAFNFVYHWDGRMTTLEQQAEWVLLAPTVMNTTWPDLLAKLQADPAYVAAFKSAYGGDLSPAQVLDALATYERSLITPNSRFDRYLRGQRQALSAEEQKGYQLFTSYGCVACHQGMNVGGNLFQAFGVFQNPPIPAPVGVAADLGRFLVTGVARDRGVFRVPGLRNVAVTAPYFHDGRARTLESAVATMAKVQLGRTLTREEIGFIVQFLHTLTGDYRGRSLAAPDGETPG